MHVIIKITVAGLLFAAAYQGFKYISSWEGEADSLVGKVLDLFPVAIETLTLDNYKRRVLESRDPWLVEFYSPQCSHCTHFQPQFDKAARMLRLLVHAGKVNCENDRYICRSAGVYMYPALLLYPGSSPSSQTQDYRGVEVYEREVDDIIKFVRKNVPKHHVHDEH